MGVLQYAASTALFSHCRGAVIAPSHRAGEPRPYIRSTYDIHYGPFGERALQAPALEEALPDMPCICDMSGNTVGDACINTPLKIAFCQKNAHILSS